MGVLGVTLCVQRVCVGAHRLPAFQPFRPLILLSYFLIEL
jgi:hypothetical protein